MGNSETNTPVGTAVGLAIVAVILVAAVLTTFLSARSVRASRLAAGTSAETATGLAILTAVVVFAGGWMLVDLVWLLGVVDEAIHRD
jgi:hypothetical protein